jgi:hypothetical protein
MNKKEQVESVHQIILILIILKKKKKMKDYVDVILHLKAMLTEILRDYINLPIYNTHCKNYIASYHAPQLGVITCLNHIVIQYLFDRKFADNYPEILFT